MNCPRYNKPCNEFACGGMVDGICKNGNITLDDETLVKICDKANELWNGICENHKECDDCELFEYVKGNKFRIACSELAFAQVAYTLGLSDSYKPKQEELAGRAGFIKKLIESGYRVRKDNDSSYAYNAYMIADEYARDLISYTDKKRLDEFNILLYKEAENGNS